MKKITIGFTTLLLFLVALTNYAYANDESWEYKDWDVSKHENLVRYITHGETVYGHEFGLIKTKGNCNQNLLWISWSTSEKGLDTFKGKDATIRFRVGEARFQLEIPVLSVVEQHPGLTVVSFSNFIVGEKFISTLKEGQRIEITIFAPNELASKFDIPTDTFSLNGFTATMQKAEEFCGGSNVANPPESKKGKAIESTPRPTEREWSIDEIEGRVNNLLSDKIDRSYDIEDMKSPEWMFMISAQLIPANYGDNPTIGLIFHASGGEGASLFSKQESSTTNKFRSIGMKPMKVNDTWIKMDVHGTLTNQGRGTLYRPYSLGDAYKLLCIFLNSEEVVFNKATFTTKNFTKTFKQYSAMLNYEPTVLGYCDSL